MIWLFPLLLIGYFLIGSAESGLTMRIVKDIRNHHPEFHAALRVSDRKFAPSASHIVMLLKGMRPLSFIHPDTGDRLDMDASYYMDSVTGDELTLTDARFDVSMSGLDLAAMESYNRVTQTLMFEPEETALLLPELQDSLYQLLAAEPEMALGPLNFIWNGDAFEAVVRIRTDSEMLPPQVAFSLMDPSLLTRIFAVEAEMDVAQALAERLAIEASKVQLRMNGQEIPAEEIDAMAEAQGPGMLLLLVAQGMLDVSGIGYRAELSFERGILDVNGREIPLGPQF